MIDPTKVLEPMLAEAERVLGEMKETKDLSERKTQSEIVKNLCESLGVFFDVMTDYAEDDLPEYYEYVEDDEDDEYEEDDE